MSIRQNSGLPAPSLSAPGAPKRITQTIAFKISFFVMGTTLMAILIAMVFLYFQQINVLQKHAKQLAVAETRTIAAALAPALEKDDFVTVKSLCNDFWKNRQLDQMHVSTATNYMVFSLTRPSEVKDQSTHKHLIKHNNKFVGTITTIFSYTEIANTRQTVLYTYIFITLAILIVVLASIYAAVKFYIQNPIREIITPPYTPQIQYAELFLITELITRIHTDVDILEYELITLTEKEQASSAALLAVQEQYKRQNDQQILALKTSHGGFWDWDLHNAHFFWSDRWKAQLGYEHSHNPKDFETFLTLLAPTDAEWLQQKLANLRQNYMPAFQFNYRIRHNDGSYHWLCSQGVCIADEAGGTSRLVGNDLDITWQKKADQTLDEAADTITTIINTAPSPIIGVNKTGIITLWNSVAASYTKRVRTESLGKPFQQMMPEFAFLLQPIRQCIAEEAPVTVERIAITGNSGTTKYYTIVIFPAMLQGTLNALVRIDDVSDYNRMGEIMIRTEKTLTIGELAAGMAHEINSPLTAILQGTQNVLRRLDPALPGNVVAASKVNSSIETIREYMNARKIIPILEEMRASGLRATTIVSNMLEFSRRGNAERCSIAVPDLVKKVMELLKNDFELKKRQHMEQLSIHTEFATALPRLTCIPLEIEQVLLNLIKNAIQAMPLRNPNRADSPAITIKAGQEGDCMRIDVCDNGPGIREDIQSELFSPFFTTKPTGQGTGLGLSVSRYIITNNYAGTLDFSSVIDKGTTFIIRLPLQQQQSMA